MSRSRPLTVVATLPAPVADIAVLVVLDSSRIDYSIAGIDGSLLSFRDNVGNAIAFDIARWDPEGSSEVWLHLPALEPSETLTMTYGEDPQRRPPADVWPGHGLVAHFEDGLLDSSPAALLLTPEGGAAAQPAILGSGIAFDGIDDAIALGEELPLFAGGSQATLSGWVYLDVIGTQGVIEYSNQPATASRVLLDVIGGVPEFGVLTSDDVGGITERVASMQPIEPEGWHWLVGTADLAAGVARIYVDGAKTGEVTLVASASEFPSTNSSVAAIGRNDTALSGFMDGTMDELHASNVAVDDAWVLARYLSMTDQLFAFGDEELGK